MADGTIPAPQVTVLEELGAWLETNGEAIFATRPWTQFGGLTRFGGPNGDDLPVRFTRSADGRTVYAIVLGTPTGTSVVLRLFAGTAASVRLLGGASDLDFTDDDGDLRIDLSEELPASAAHAFAIRLAD